MIYARFDAAYKSNLKNRNIKKMQVQIIIIGITSF